MEELQLVNEGLNHFDMRYGMCLDDSFSKRTSGNEDGEFLLKTVMFGQFCAARCLGGFEGLEFVYYVAIYLCISKENVRVLEELRSTSCRVMAIVMRWEN